MNIVILVAQTVWCWHNSMINELCSGKDLEGTESVMA
jgi:hypothetical protein